MDLPTDRTPTVRGHLLQLRGTYTTDKGLLQTWGTYYRQGVPTTDRGHPTTDRGPYRQGIPRDEGPYRQDSQGAIYTRNPYRQVAPRGKFNFKNVFVVTSYVETNISQLYSLLIISKYNA